MLWTWGSLAFPFTSARDEELWKQQTWGIKLLADSIDEAIPNWIAEDNYICLYGGGNIDWIKKFTAKAKEVAEASHIKLHILYVGEWKPEIYENISTITEEKLSHSLQDLCSVQFFWKRLRKIHQSRMENGFTLENDLIIQDINTILSFDNNYEEWTVFCKRSAMAIANGEIILQCLSDFDLWRTYMNDKDFVTALNHYRLVQLMESPHKDNLEILWALIYAKKVQLPLLKGDTKERADFEVLHSKTLLLLISDLEFANEELFMLEQSYKGSREDPTKQYEIVWIPVVDKSTQWNKAKQAQFENHLSRMPWYSVYLPLMIKPGVLMYIELVWKFKKKPIVVVLEPEGKVVNSNALHMLRIWGSLALPFTCTREAGLWTQEISRIELLADSIDTTIPIWIQEENYTCLYGGENIDWIREFTATARKVAEAASIPLQILYVGKSNSKEKHVRKIIDTITVKNLSHSLQEYQQDGHVLFSGRAAMAMAKGETILQCLNDFDSWKAHMEDKDFVAALNHHLNQLQKHTSMGETEHN
ncbi:hypothetical protein Patl1_33443 [Pistacia atlantica]|uniref:Uncharacterized protein n=1 Tax=Pistacia atlantica TaxID=434234 RepID=A0ACC0ZW48_9ROSI|nr:hypothetical protein Patl1_33443 [Pistacia atlantica]